VLEVKMNRRSILASLAALLGNAVPTKADVQFPTIRLAGESLEEFHKRVDWRENQHWAREIIVGDGTCGFTVLPLIEGNGPDAVVIAMFKHKTFFGDDAVIDAFVVELEEHHVGRPASLLALLNPRERNYQEK
jgi:hypothetical protein